MQKKISETGNSLNAVDREPVPTRVPNPSEASYRPEQRRGGSAMGGIAVGGSNRGGNVREGIVHGGKAPGGTARG